MPAQPLLFFHAGKMYRENETSNVVHPDLRKGYIQIQHEDGLLHFQWRERSATEPEDDLIIFPEDAKFLRVDEATDGRVYMLRFETSKAKHFFWMQDKSDARDNWNVERLNTLINDPNAPATDDMPDGESNPVASVLQGFGGPNANRARGAPGSVDPVINEELLNSTLAAFPGGAESLWEGMQGGIGREELLQMLASEMQPALRNTLLTNRSQSMSNFQTPASSQQPPLFPSQSQEISQPTAQPSSALPPELQAQLASISAGLPGGSGAPRQEYMSLGDVLTRDVLNRVLAMPEVGERLRPGMPENWNQEDIGDVIQSPQFQQALSSLSSAISTGQLAPLLRQFGLSGGIDDVESFLRAVEEQVRREQQGGGSSGTQEGQDDDRMQED